MTVVPFTSPGSGTWLCPSGVTLLTSVACWGAGGGGSKGGGLTGGGGGGGGEYAAEVNVQVTPGQLYRWVVGQGGPGGTGSGTNAGGTSMFTADTLSVVAHGGDSGGGDRLGGTGSTNTTHFNGGNGAAAGSSGGAGGGSSGGSGGAGGNGSAPSGAAGGAGGTPPAGGGTGGDGANAVGGRNNPGQPGFAPGGGGGGAADFLSTPGGAGAAGQVQITYTAPQQPQIPFFPAGYAPTSDDFANWITNPLQFLTQKIAFRGVCGTAMVLTANTNVALPMTVLEDPYAGWQASGTQWLAPQNGLYSVTVAVSCAANSNQPVVAAKAGINSQAQTFTLAKAWVPPSSVPGLASGSVLTYLYGGQDSVQALAEAIGAAGTVATGTGIAPRMSVMWFSD